MSEFKNLAALMSCEGGTFGGNPYLTTNWQYFTHVKHKADVDWFVSTIQGAKSNRIMPHINIVTRNISQQGPKTLRK